MMGGPEALYGVKGSSMIIRRPHLGAGRYQTLRFRLGMLVLILSMREWRVTANPRGPKLSSCCTLQQLVRRGEDDRHSMEHG